jgi:CheY-like chemotaxis protein
MGTNPHLSIDDNFAEDVVALNFTYMLRRLGGSRRAALPVVNDGRNLMNMASKGVRQKTGRPQNKRNAVKARDGVKPATAALAAAPALMAAEGEVEGHVLLVEDDARTSRVMRKLLEAADIKVKSAATVKEAIAGLADMPPLVVLDLLLPDGSGIDVLKSIRDLSLRCKVAVISGATDPDLFAQLRLLHPDAVFAKPLDFEDFVRWLGEAFGSDPVN